MTVDTAPPRQQAGESLPSAERRFTSPHTLTPRTNLLSNGQYAVMITVAGSGYSRWRDIAVTRWQEDPTCDGWGSYVFLRDMRDGTVWSAGYQPTGTGPDHYEADFSEGYTKIVRQDGTITTTLELTVSSEYDAEVRRVSIANDGSQVREIELTSYAEIVLAPHAADDEHPAYSKLFVETEFVADAGAILATRRQGSPGNTQIWAAHFAVVEGETIGDGQFETDRARFFGRGRGVRMPMAMANGATLSNTVGAVLDPIFSIRRQMRVPPGTTARIEFWTLVAPSRDEVLVLVGMHHGIMAFDRATALARIQAQVQLHHLGIDVDDAHLFQSLANRVLYAEPTLRPPSESPRTGWRAGIPALGRRDLRRRTDHPAAHRRSR